MNKTLKRQYYNVVEAKFAETTSLKDGVLYISKKDLQEQIKDLLKAVKNVDFELVQPGENTRIIHLLDTLQPMYKIEGEGSQFPGHFSDPVMVGTGTTNVLSGFSVMESAALP